MIKKLFSIIFSAVIVFSVLTVSAFSAEPAQTYEIFILAPDGLIIDKSESAPESGEVVTLTASSVPNDYAVSSVTATDAFSQEVTVTKQSDNVYYFTMPASNVTVTAALAPTYPVTYYINGGTSQLYRSDYTGFDSPYVAGNYTEGETFSVGAMPDPLNQNGKMFKEWNTEEDGSGDGYFSIFNENFDNTCDITMPGEPLTLYAIWVDICDVTVNINLDGRLYPDYGKEIEMSLWYMGTPLGPTPNLLRNTETFTDVPATTVFLSTSNINYSTGEQSNYEDLGTVIISENTTLTINYYTVSFNSRGGSDVGSQIVLSGKKATAPTNPTKADDTFRGWSTNETTYTPYDFSSTDVASTTTLYAFWNSDTNNTPPPSYPSYTPSYTSPIIIPALRYEVGYTKSFTTKTGITATVTLTETGIIVTAGMNESGSVNSECTRAAVAEAAKIARTNGLESIRLIVPEGATGLSKSTVQKLVKAVNGKEIILKTENLTLPINEKTGQILTGLKFDSENIKTAQNYITKRWNTDILGSFETAQRGGWGGTATLTIGLDKLGFSADDGTKLYALIYDTKTEKWYQAAAEVIDGANVVIKTKRSGIVTIVTQKVK